MQSKVTVLGGEPSCPPVTSRADLGPGDFFRYRNPADNDHEGLFLWLGQKYREINLSTGDHNTRYERMNDKHPIILCDVEIKDRPSLGDEK